MQAAFQGNAFVLISSVLFGTLGFLQAIAPEGATPYVVGTVQTLVGSIALFAWLGLRGKLPRPSELRTWSLPALAISVAVMSAFQIVFFLGVAKAGVTVGTVVSMGITPIASAAAAWLFFRMPPTRRWYPATAAAVAGLVLMNVSDGLSASLSALALPILSGILYGTYLVTSPRIAPESAPEAVTMAISILCTVILSPCLLLFPTDWLFTPQGLFVSAALGIGIEAFAFSLLMAGLVLTRPSTAATLTLAEPLTAALLGTLVLGETASAATLLGIVLLGAALVILAADAPDDSEPLPA